MNPPTQQDLRAALTRAHQAGDGAELDGGLKRRHVAVLEVTLPDDRVEIQPAVVACRADHTRMHEDSCWRAGHNTRGAESESAVTTPCTKQFSSE